MEIKEEWKDIEGYEGLYQISNYGRVKSLERECKNRWGQMRVVEEKILKGSPNSDGYLCVSLCKNGTKKSYRVNRLVAIAFIPNPNDLEEVDHIDGNKEKNIFTNLRWVSRLENMQNENTVNKRKAEKDKYGRKGEDHWKSKRVVQLSLNGELIKIYGSIREASRETKFHHESIRHCCKRDNKEYKGFKWMYYEDYIQLKGEIDNGNI